MIGVPPMQVDQLRHVVWTLYEIYQGVTLYREEDLDYEGIVFALTGATDKLEKVLNSHGVNLWKDMIGMDKMDVRNQNTSN